MIQQHHLHQLPVTGLKSVDHALMIIGSPFFGRVMDNIKYIAVQQDLQLVVLGRGEWRYEQLFQEARRRYPGKLSVNILFSEDLARRIYAGADLLLMPSKSEPCGLSQMVAMRYGTLPLVRETGGLADTVQAYNAATGEGNSFSFTNYNAHDMLYTLQAAISLYREDRAVWDKLVTRGMETDFSWNASAARYLSLYRSLK